MSSLPKFTELQQKIVIRKLIEMDSHRVIAQYLQHASPEFKPPDMDQEEYEQAVIKRCKDYVSNKNRKWYQIIQEGREKFKEEMIRWSIHELMRASFVADSFPHQDAMQSINIKDAMEIADMVCELTDRIYTSIYGEREYIRAWHESYKSRGRADTRTHDGGRANGEQGAQMEWGL